MRKHSPTQNSGIPQGAPPSASAVERARLAVLGELLAVRVDQDVGVDGGHRRASMRS